MSTAIHLIPIKEIDELEQMVRAEPQRPTTSACDPHDPLHRAISRISSPPPNAATSPPLPRWWF